MTKNTTNNETIVGETVETPAPEKEKAIVVNWKKIGKIAAGSAALVGIGLLIGIAISSEEDEENDIETTEPVFELDVPTTETTETE